MPKTNDLPTSKPPAPFTKEDGWGIDLDPAVRPAVPKEAPSNVKTPRGEVPPRMVPNVRIHMSPEHPDLPPVFGTTCPPRGLSGRIRDAAYHLSEGRISHWLLLLLADRIDVVEGLVEDLGHGRLPNIPRERGWKAELTEEAPPEHRRNQAMAGAAVVGGLVALAILWPKVRRRSRGR